jgi:hypothetical protein
LKEKTTFFILTIHFYNTPYITLFILQYLLLKLFKRIAKGGRERERPEERGAFEKKEVIKDI